MAVAGERLADRLGRLTPAERDEILAQFSQEELEELEHEWEFWARSNQLPPGGDWLVWLILAGRGWGKTRTGGEWVRARAESGKFSRFILAGPTAADVRDVMIEGESGILALSPPSFRPLYKPSRRSLEWPNGARALLLSADEPDRFRGPQSDSAWCDELASWKHPEAFDMLLFGLRLGRDPRCIITTTPKPLQILRDLLIQDTTIVTGGSTYENRANLAPAFFRQIISKYENTNLGRQEIYAVLLSDAEGALWDRAMIDGSRAAHRPNDLARIVVAIDPATTAGDRANETGIVVCGLGRDGHVYVLADVTGKFHPDEWARLAVETYRLMSADLIVGEVNNGGDLVEAVIRTVDPEVSFKKVHASRGKRTRAEPVAALYKQNLVHHVGRFEFLEDQMCTYVPEGNEKSPDRMDALVWGVTELKFGRARPNFMTVGPAGIPGRSKFRGR